MNRIYALFIFLLFSETRFWIAKMTQNVSIWSQNIIRSENEIDNYGCQTVPYIIIDHA